MYGGHTTPRDPRTSGGERMQLADFSVVPLFGQRIWKMLLRRSSLIKGNQGATTTSSRQGIPCRRLYTSYFLVKISANFVSNRHSIQGKPTSMPRIYKSVPFHCGLPLSAAHQLGYCRQSDSSLGPAFLPMLLDSFTCTTPLKSEMTIREDGRLLQNYLWYVGLAICAGRGVPDSSLSGMTICRRPDSGSLSLSSSMS